MKTGLTQGAILFLGLWVYPFLMLFKNKSIERVWGLVCSIGSVIGAIAYIADKSGTFMGRSVSFAGTGAWVFLIASGALIYGVLQYRPSKAD
jgi:hypothetical protein